MQTLTMHAKEQASDSHVVTMGLSLRIVVSRALRDATEISGRLWSEGSSLVTRVIGRSSPVQYCTTVRTEYDLNQRHSTL